MCEIFDKIQLVPFLLLINSEIEKEKWYMFNVHFGPNKSIWNIWMQINWGAIGCNQRIVLIDSTSWHQGAGFATCLSQSGFAWVWRDLPAMHVASFTILSYVTLNSDDGAGWVPRNAIAAIVRHRHSIIPLWHKTESIWVHNKIFQCVECLSQIVTTCGLSP